MPVSETRSATGPTPSKASDASSGEDSTAALIQPRGPVFLSYRQSDGTQLAFELAAALRAFGVPVWHDQSDLPPGDTNKRLKEALQSGLSGALVLVTPEMVDSLVVREIEFPALIAQEENSDFIFAIANSVMRTDAPERLDYGAPDRILYQPAGKLSGVKQFSVVDPDGVLTLAKDISVQRMATLRGTADALDLHIQTRVAPRSNHEPADLVVRLPTPLAGRRSPPAGAWPTFAAFLNWLPQLVAELGVDDLRVRGGAHLSAAYALGAALPSTSGRAITVLDPQGRSWGPAADAGPIALRVKEESLPGTGGATAVFVDLVGTSQPVDSFGSHIRDERQHYSHAMRITQASSAPIPSAAGAATAMEIARQILSFAAEARTAKLDLFLRAPFPLAVLLGCRLNTLEVCLYEWEDGISPPEYRPSIRVASGRGNSPIVKVEADETGEL